MMGVMTIRGLDDAAAARLKQEANTRGVSVNSVLRQLVREGLGLDRSRRGEPHADLDALAGTWTADEADAFEQAVEPFEQVEPEQWR
jgi:plasmid stability protein